MADPNKIPLDVRIAVCADCGAYGVNLEACRAEHHHVSTVHYEISAEHGDSVAIQRVEQLQKHGRHLLSAGVSHT